MDKRLLFFATLCLCGSIAMSQSNYLDNYIGSSVTLATIGASGNSIDQPRDLDFKPNSNELWVVNYGTVSGGTNVIFYNAGLPDQISEYLKDSHTSHFMVYPSALAMSDEGKWASVGEVKNTAGNNTSTFMGPSLWSSDTSIFARVFQNNWLTGYPLGSHLDMLHQSPYSMGIAHDTAMVYWVLDGHNGNICKYDYVQHHGPGYDDHSAGRIWRYSDISFNRVPNIPSHCVLDKSSGWLYFIEGGSKSIRRLNTNSGTVTGALTPPFSGYEDLDEYWEVENATVEILETLTTQPCGIDFYNGRLIVSDYDNGNIYLYSTDGGFTLLETIVTGYPGMMGVKVGPDGHIWCVNNTESKVYRLDVNASFLDAAIISIDAPTVENYLPNFYSTAFNVCDDIITPSITVLNRGTSAITEMDLMYALDSGTPVFYNWVGTLDPGNTTSITFPSSAVLDGPHLLTAEIISLGGFPDDVEENNTYTGSFRVIATPLSLPFLEDFGTNLFPPESWNYVNYNPNNYMKWVSTGGFGNSVGSMKMDNYSGAMDITGQKDYLISPILDFTDANASTQLRFNVAYAQYNNQSVDELQVVVSTDCGASWSEVYDKMGSTLSTAPNSTSSWTPSATQWRTDSVNLGSFAGQTEVILMFTSISNFGNNLYVDDIHVGDLATAISDSENSAFRFTLFPNPASQFVMVSCENFSVSDLSKIEFKNALGQMVKSFNPKSSSPLTIPVSDLSDGMYFIQISDGKNIYSEKFFKQ